jgi:hypothetical protein
VEAPRVTGLGEITLRGDWTLAWHSGDVEDDFWIKVGSLPTVQWPMIGDDNDKMHVHDVRLGNTLGTVRFSEDLDADYRPVSIRRNPEGGYFIDLEDDTGGLEITLLLERVVLVTDGK